VNRSDVDESFEEMERIEDKLNKIYVHEVNLPDGLKDMSVEAALDKVVAGHDYSPTARSLVDWQIRVNFPLDYGAVRGFLFFVLLLLLFLVSL
jgi:hypothetical protein